MGCELRAGVLVEAAPVDGLGAEVEAALDLDTVDVEAVARLDVGALLALEICVLDGVDLVRAGRQIPGGGAGGIEARPLIGASVRIDCGTTLEVAAGTRFWATSCSAFSSSATGTIRKAGRMFSTVFLSRPVCSAIAARAAPTASTASAAPVPAIVLWSAWNSVVPSAICPQWTPHKLRKLGALVARQPQCRLF